MTRDRNFHRTFWPLMMFLVIQNVITLSVNLLDNVMLGGYSEAALAGASAANQLFFILQQLVGGISEGLVVLAAQYWGQKRTEPIQRLAGIALWLAVFVSLIFFLITFVAPEMCLRLFTPDAEIVVQGALYLRVMSWTFPIVAVTMVLLAMLRSVETVRVAVIVSITALLTNGLLNYMFIYGRFGAPEMGAEGAAIATLCSRVLELAVVSVYLFKVDKKIHLKLKNFFHPGVVLIRDYFRVSIPTMIIGFQWGLNTALQTVILGHIATNAIAANSIAGNLVMLLKVFAGAAAAAAGLTIGKTVGTGAIEKVKEYARSLQVIFLLIGVFIFTGILLLRAPVLALYNITPATKDLAAQFLTIMAFTSFGMSYQMPTLTGIVRGGGDTRFVMINDLISIWGIVIPFSLLAAFVFNWPPVAVMICLQSDQVFKCIPAAIKVNRFNWIKQLTRKAA